MKKTTKVKMGPLGTPLGNPLGYFNSLKGKKTEPKQTLRKAQDGIEMENDMMINKPGSTGGYKNTRTPSNQYNNEIRKYFENGQFDSSYEAPGTNPVQRLRDSMSNINAANQSQSQSQSQGQGQARSKMQDQVETFNQAKDQDLNQKKLRYQELLRKKEIEKFGKPIPTPTPTEEVPGVYKKGGSHKMPNGKMMLNSAMKKKTSKNK